VSTTRATDGSALSPQEAAAWTGLLRTHQGLISQLDAELQRAHDLSLAEYDVFVQLDEAPGRSMRMAELADAVLLTRSGVTRLVDRLQKRGYVERRPCPADARGMHAVLTDAGAERFRQAAPTHREGIRRLFLGKLQESDIELLGAIWRRLAP
jgi:DNA-binding MarR family transcriptional regulator